MPIHRKVARLRILATSDLHMRLIDHPYFGPGTGTGPRGSLAQVAQLVRDARAQAETEGRHVLLVDNGDLVSGPPLDVEGFADPDAHPLPEIFGFLGYDVLGLGNHDFDRGAEPLTELARRMPCPVLCANVFNADGTAVFDATAKISVRIAGAPSINVGFFSVLPPQTARWNAHHFAADLRTRPAETVSRKISADLADAGCDVIVALAHMGLGNGSDEEGDENAALAVARSGRLDAIVMGHAHLTFPGAGHPRAPDVDPWAGTVAGIPAVMPAWAGRALGQIDLDLSHSDRTGWRIEAHRVRVVPVTPDTLSDPVVLRLARPLHDRSLRRLQQPVGHTLEPLHSYFAHCAPDRALRLVARAQAAAIKDGLPPGLPLLSAVSPARSGGRSGAGHFTDIPPGTLTQRDVLELYPFDNTLTVLRVTGAMILDWLEYGASVFNRLLPGRPEQMLLNPDWAGYQFDVLHGLTYCIDPTRPARYAPDGRLDPSGGRIGEVRLGKHQVKPDAEFLVVTNSHRAQGGAVPSLDAAPRVPVPLLPVRAAIRQYLQQPSIKPEPPAAVWRFSPAMPVAARLRTGPGASRYLNDPTLPRHRMHAIDAEGFLPLTVYLQPEDRGDRR